MPLSYNIFFWRTKKVPLLLQIRFAPQWRCTMVWGYELHIEHLQVDWMLVILPLKYCPRTNPPTSSHHQHTNFVQDTQCYLLYLKCACTSSDFWIGHCTKKVLDICDRIKILCSSAIQAVYKLCHCMITWYNLNNKSFHGINALKQYNPSTVNPFIFYWNWNILEFIYSIILLKHYNPSTVNPFIFLWNWNFLEFIYSSTLNLTQLGLNPWPPDHTSTFHVPEVLSVKTEPPGTSTILTHKAQNWYIRIYPTFSC